MEFVLLGAQGSSIALTYHTGFISFYKPFLLTHKDFLSENTDELRKDLLLDGNGFFHIRFDNTTIIYFKRTTKWGTIEEDINKLSKTYNEDWNRVLMERDSKKDRFTNVLYKDGFDIKKEDYKEWIMKWLYQKRLIFMLGSEEF